MQPGPDAAAGRAEVQAQLPGLFPQLRGPAGHSPPAHLRPGGVAYRAGAGAGRLPQLLPPPAVHPQPGQLPQLPPASCHRPAILPARHAAAGARSWPPGGPRILTSLLGWSQAGLQCLIFPFLIAPCVCRLEACSSVSATFGIK